MLAFFTCDGQGSADLMLCGIAAHLQAEGLRLAGAVQVNLDRPDRPRCDMALNILGTDQSVTISQYLGPEATACRLDPGGLAQAAGLIEQRLADPVDLVLVNKFGKQEAEGGGLRSVFALALTRGVPVLTSVNRTNLDAFRAFSGGIAEKLPADPQRLTRWCGDAVAERDLARAQ